MRKTAFFILVFACAAMLGNAGTLRAVDDTVWSALVLATNEDQPKEAPEERERLEPKLRKVFGYNQLQLIGQHAERMDDPSERWLVPSKTFCLRVTSKTADKAGYKLQMELYQEDRRLTEFEAKLSPQSAIFIRGPQYAGGQLIIVVVAK